jgi:hypothetical protein
MSSSNTSRSSQQKLTGQSKPFCSLLPRTVPQLRPAVLADPRRAAAIISTNSKWVNGTVLHYYFFTKGHFTVPAKQADAVRAAFRKWKAVGIGLEFKGHPAE